MKLDIKNVKPIAGRRLMKAITSVQNEDYGVVAIREDIELTPMAYLISPTLFDFLVESYESWARFQRNPRVKEIMLYNENIRLRNLLRTTALEFRRQTKRDDFISEEGWEEVRNTLFDGIERYAGMLPKDSA